MEKTFRISAKEIKLDKNSFIACMSKINDDWYKIKFRQDCNDVPKKKGLYDLTLEYKDCNIEKGQTYTGKDGQKYVDIDTIWVNKVKKLHKLTDEELGEINEEKMKNIFGE